MFVVRALVIFALLVVSSVSNAQAAPVPLVNSDDVWQVHKGTNAPQADWKTTADGQLDSLTWFSAQGGFGFSTDNPGELVDCHTSLGDMQNRYTTAYMRKSFEVTTPPAASLHLLLSVDWDDGFVVWLDGNLLTNMLAGPSEPGYTGTASANHESSHGNTGNSPQPAMTFDCGEVGARLGNGTHTLAMIGLNVSSGSSDFVQVADLVLDTPPEPPSNSISGTLTVDRTLFTSNSPYAVIGNLTIADGVTLTVEAGTELQLWKGVNITVSSLGRIVAEGTEQQPVRLVRPAGVSDFWGAITINGAVGSPENRLVHTYLEGNGNRCITVTGGTVYFDHVRFGTTDKQYLALDDASFLITDCHFPGSTAQFEPVHGTIGIKTGGRGIFRRCFFGPISGYCDTVDFTGGNRPGEIIQFIDNVFMGSGDDNLDFDSTDAWVQGNIFLHLHKNGSPDTSSAVSGGNDDGNTGDVTILGNIFYDCDQAVMCKQGNFYALINNTIVHQSHIGGLDTEGAVLCLQDNNMTEGRGMYLEGNIIYDIERLTRNVVTGIVTFQDNLMPLPWAGPGTGNSAADPMLAHIPQLAETYFTNWAEAQIMKQWLKPLAGSPAVGSGPNGFDKGGAISMGVSISGEPAGDTTNTAATLTVGINRRGGSIPASDWPNGSGYTHYKWRLDTKAWSAETPITNPIQLTDLAVGPHHVEVIGKNDAGFYQDDTAFGPDAVVSRSKTWSVQAQHPSFELSSISVGAEGVTLAFPGLQGSSYRVLWTDSLASGSWQVLTNVSALTMSGTVQITDVPATGQTRFYRVVTP